PCLRDERRAGEEAAGKCPGPACQDRDLRDAGAAVLQTPPLYRALPRLAKPCRSGRVLSPPSAPAGARLALESRPAAVTPLHGFPPRERRMSFRPTPPSPGIALARLLLASVFIVMGAWRLWGAWDGASASGATLTFSAAELVLGVLVAAGWKLRAVALA